MASLIVKGAADAAVPIALAQAKTAIAREKKRALIPNPHLAPSTEARISINAAQRPLSRTLNHFRYRDYRGSPHIQHVSGDSGRLWRKYHIQIW
jgi:hypothetical protein